MRALKTSATLAMVLAVAGCDTSLGPDLTGLWVAGSYEYRSESGETIDLVERDGASFNLTTFLAFDGRRVVTTIFEDGHGGQETMSGEVFVDEGTFTFETVVFDFTHRDGALVLVSATSQTFDFGAGDESATLTIRLTQL